MKPSSWGTPPPSVMGKQSEPAPAPDPLSLAEKSVSTAQTALDQAVAKRAQRAAHLANYAAGAHAGNQGYPKGYGQTTGRPIYEYSRSASPGTVREAANQLGAPWSDQDHGKAFNGKPYTNLSFVADPKQSGTPLTRQPNVKVTLADSQVDGPQADLDTAVAKRDAIVKAHQQSS